MASSKLSAPAALALIVNAISKGKLVKRVSVSNRYRFIAFRNRARILFASAGEEGKPTMPIDGAVSIEFRGDLIFIGDRFSLSRIGIDKTYRHWPAAIG